MSDPIAISVKSVSKNFKLPHQKTSSIKDIFVRPLQALRGGKTLEVQHALKDISFDVKQGEFFGIVGRNGSGKSTLLKILAEIYQPTSGEVSVKGRLVPFIELGVGFNPELTGRENVYLSGALNGFSEKEIDDMYNDIVEFAELEQFMDQKLKNYSSGMQVRLAFSVATRAKADVLLIDEVLAVGDADFQRKCFNYFKSLKKSETTVIFVSHDMDAVREYCDRALLIDDHNIVNIGTPDSIAQDYSRLFTDGLAMEKSQGDEGSRWGRGGIVSDKVNVNIETDRIIVKHEVKSSIAIDDPVIGLRVRSMDGSSITGTNTRIEHIEGVNFVVGQTRVFEWEMQNIFADGSYFIDTAVMAADNVTVYDWWDEAATMNIAKGRRVPYPVDLGFKVKF